MSIFFYFVQNHDTASPLPPLPEGGEVEERAVVTDDNQGTSRLESEVAGSRKSAASSEKEIETEATESTRSSLPAASPKNKRKRDDVVDSGTSEAGAARAKEPAPDAGKRAFDPYEAALISS
jgi:vacuolar-type H+-ATPase subunit H